MLTVRYKCMQALAMQIGWIRNPSPYVTWWKDSVLISDKFSAKQGGVMVNELTIPALSREDLHQGFECQAANNNITKPSTTRVLLELVFLNAKVVDSRPPAVITWWKGSEKMTSTKTSFLGDSNISRSVLTFTPSAEDNGKYISCRADNPDIPDSAQENGRKLRVNFKPIVEVRSRDNTSDVIEGSNVFLECHVAANPWINTIKWFFNDKSLLDSGIAALDSTTSTLMLRKVNNSNVGAYSCAATNTQGTGSSNKIKLNVKYRPVCQNSGTVIIGAGLQESVEIKCKVEADPADLKFTWLFKGVDSENELKNFRIKGKSSVVRVLPTNFNDFGTFYCSAKNTIGLQNKPCIFKLIHAGFNQEYLIHLLIELHEIHEFHMIVAKPQLGSCIYLILPTRSSSCNSIGPPHTPTNCTISNRTSSTLTIECVAGYNGGLNQTFFMEVFEDFRNRILFNATSEDKPKFVASGLPSGTLFTLTVYSSNVKGQSDRFVINSRTLGEDYFADALQVIDEAEELISVSNRKGLEINLSKTEVMLNKHVVIPPIRTGNVTWDQFIQGKLTRLDYEKYLKVYVYEWKSNVINIPIFSSHYIH
ncbi:B-cell receptor CD22 [Nymphon striatum]|nr:B-cell receptor CD22 [Nymphon striatum]